MPLGSPPVAASVLATRLPPSQRGGLYMTLKRLQARGLVNSEVDGNRDGGTRRWTVKAIGVGELAMFDELVGRPPDDEDPLGLGQ